MFRKLGGFFSLVAALLCIGMVALWVRSRHHADVLLVRTAGHHAAGVATVKSGLLLAQSDVPFDCFVSDTLEEQAVSLVLCTPDQFKKFEDVLIEPQTTVRFSFLGFKTATGQAPVTSTLNVRFTAMII